MNCDWPNFGQNRSPVAPLEIGAPLVVFLRASEKYKNGLLFSFDLYFPLVWRCYTRSTPVALYSMPQWLNLHLKKL